MSLVFFSRFRLFLALLFSLSLFGSCQLAAAQGNPPPIRDPGGDGGSGGGGVQVTCQAIQSQHAHWNSQAQHYDLLLVWSDNLRYPNSDGDCRQYERKVSCPNGVQMYMGNDLNPQCDAWFCETNTSCTEPGTSGGGSAGYQLIRETQDCNRPFGCPQDHWPD